MITISATTRVLLADDHALVRAGIGNALKDQPYLHIVGEVGNGPELLHALETLQPNLLLIDVTMPEFEPITAIRHILATYPQLYILVVSAYDDDIYVQGLLSAGVHGYHMKDQPLSDLRLAVERILNGGRWISSPLLDKLLRATHPTEGNPVLSTRQRDILHLLSQSLDNRAIAQRLGLSMKTIETHLTRLYRQLNVQSRLEAANYVHDHPDIVNQINRINHPASTVAYERPSSLLPQSEQAAILVVDDNRRYRNQFRRTISKVFPATMIYEAGNMGEALQLAKRVVPKLIFVDVVLGDEDGIRCASRLKAQLPSARIILISAYPDREFHRRGLEAGATAFLDKKDLDAAALQQIIEDAIG